MSCVRRKEDIHKYTGVRLDVERYILKKKHTQLVVTRSKCRQRGEVRMHYSYMGVINVKKAKRFKKKHGIAKL